MNDAGGVGGIRIAGARAHGQRAVQHGQRRAEYIRRFAGRIDDGERYGKSEKARALGEGIPVGENDEWGEALVAALEPRPQCDLQPDTGRIAHGDGQRPPSARIRPAAHQRYSICASVRRSFRCFLERISNSFWRSSFCAVSRLESAAFTSLRPHTAHSSTPFSPIVAGSNSSSWALSKRLRVGSGKLVGRRSPRLSKRAP